MGCFFGIKVIVHKEGKMRIKWKIWDEYDCLLDNFKGDSEKGKQRFKELVRKLK